MVRLTEVEDEHFKEKPSATKNDVLLATTDDEDDDFTDTGMPAAPLELSAFVMTDKFFGGHAESEISTDSYTTLEEESFVERISALKDIISPQSRYKITSTISSLSSFASKTVSFGGKTLWVLSTSAFLLGVPFAMAYGEEQQFVQMEREQGMIKGANEVRTDCFLKILQHSVPAICGS
jgi:import receptor subunit TOM22